MLVGEWILEIPGHAQNDDLSRELAAFERIVCIERIVRIDRHGILPHQDAGSAVRNRAKYSAKSFRFHRDPASDRTKLQ
jgi:hypothetical protein